MQLRAVCDKRLYVPIREFWWNFYRHSTNFKFFCNNVSIIEDKIFATDFLRFFGVISKKRKKSRFFEIWKKNEKYVFSNTECRLLYNQCLCQREVVMVEKKLDVSAVYTGYFLEMSAIAKHQFILVSRSNEDTVASQLKVIESVSCMKTMSTTRIAVAIGRRSIKPRLDDDRLHINRT